MSHGIVTEAVCVVETVHDLDQIKVGVRIGYVSPAIAHASLPAERVPGIGPAGPALIGCRINLAVCVSNWRVKGSCSLVQLEGVRISAAFVADSGGQEFLEDCALGRTSEKIRPGVAKGVRDDPLGRRFLRASRADVGVEIEPGYPPEGDGQILEKPLGDEA